MIVKNGGAGARGGADEGGGDAFDREGEGEGEGGGRDRPGAENTRVEFKPIVRSKSGSRRGLAHNVRVELVGLDDRPVDGALAAHDHERDDEP